MAGEKRVLFYDVLNLKCFLADASVLNWNQCLLLLAN